MEAIIIVVVLAVAAVIFLQRGQGKHDRTAAQSRVDDEVAEARRWIERLGNQVLTLAGSDTASTQALADASERYTAASSAIGSATTVKQARLARESALEGMHYVNAARKIMGMPTGPALPPLEGQRSAGSVTERRTINHNGETITASPEASADTPNYYPGGRVAGRPVPAGWYSSPWWASALASGVWTAGSVMLFSSLFAGMSGVNYSADAFADGYGAGLEDAAGGGGELGAGEDAGGNMDDGGGWDMEGDAGGDFGDGAFGGGDFTGGDFGGDGGIFDLGFDF